MSMRRSAVYAAVTEHNMMVVDLEEAQATIARVREVCDQADEDGTALVWLADVRRALEGDSDD